MGHVNKPHECVHVGGIVKYNAKWERALRVVARLAFLLPFLTPDDVTAFTELAALLGIRLGEVLPGVHLVILFLAHAVKWPPVVRHLAHLLVARASPGGDIVRLTASFSATDLALLLRELAVFADGGAWPTMFREMNGVGLMDAQTGLAVNFVKLGLLSRSGPGHALRLGPGQSNYTLAPQESEAQIAVEKEIGSLMALADEKEVRWPSNRLSAMEFGRSVFDFAKQARTPPFKLDGGNKSGAVSAKMYHVKHFVRAMLLGAATKDQGIVDGLTGEELAQFCPDQKEYLVQAAVAKLSGAEIRNTFGCEPLMYACWTCLAQSLSNQESDAILLASDADIMNHVNTYFKAVLEASAADPPWPPGPHALGKALGEDSS